MFVAVVDFSLSLSLFCDCSMFTALITESGVVQFYFLPGFCRRRRAEQQGFMTVC